MFINKRSVAAAIVFSILTCGLYTFYWVACIANDLNALEERHEGPTGGMVVLLTFITCGIYGIYFVWQASKRVYFLFEDYGVRASDNAIINLIITLLGFNIVAYAIIQNDINNLIDAKANAQSKE